MRCDVAAAEEGKRLTLAVQAFASIPHGIRSQIDAEAAALAAFRNCTTVEVAFAESK